ncbi:hypothetical protein CsSME_00010915 [Camellia sinensis var. sinensis]
MQPIPAKSEGREGFRTSHPLLLVVASDETGSLSPMQNGRDVRDGYIEPQSGSLLNSPTAVRFYSLRSHNYVHVLRFRSTVYMVRCSPRTVVVGLAAQVSISYTALTLLLLRVNSVSLLILFLSWGVREWLELILAMAQWLWAPDG